MRLALFKQRREIKKALKSLAKTQKMLEKNGTFTFHDPENSDGLVMEYRPKSVFLKS